MVVACVDGSPFSEQALPVATEWSAMFGLRLWLVQIRAPGTRLPDVDCGDYSETAYLRHLAEHSPDVHFDVLQSRHPADELADFAERMPVSVMVMATHGRSGWSRLTLGSMAMNVVHHATCPVLLVPPKDSGRDVHTDHDRVAL